MNKLAAIPLFASALGVGILGLLLMLAALQSAEFGCAILARD